MGLPRPGGNATGFIALEGSMAGKWLEVLKEIAPRVTRVAFMFNPATAPYAEQFLKAFKAAAASFPVEAIVAPVHDISELESVVAAQARELLVAYAVAFAAAIAFLAAVTLLTIPARTGHGACFRGTCTRHITGQE